MKYCNFMLPETPISQSVVVQSSPAALNETCKELLSKLKTNNFSEENIFAVHLALEEAFLNAVIHGNRMNLNKEVKVDYSVGLGEVRISVTDEGEGFDPNSVPDPRCVENIYKTRGRGLLLMRSYMDVVKFNQHGNRVDMVKYKEDPPSIPNLGKNTMDDK